VWTRSRISHARAPWSFFLHLNFNLRGILLLFHLSIDCKSSGTPPFHGSLIFLWLLLFRWLNGQKIALSHSFTITWDIQYINEDRRKVLKQIFLSGPQFTGEAGWYGILSSYWLVHLFSNKKKVTGPRWPSSKAPREHVANLFNAKFLFRTSLRFWVLWIRARVK
jgi:hypothetical protein